MSAKPTSIARAAVLCTLATSLAVPGIATAHKQDKPAKPGKSTPAVCDHQIPPGLKKKDKLPKGVQKKVDGQAPCEGNPQGDPADEVTIVNNVLPAPVVVAAPAPATVVANSSRPANCVSRRVFRVRLDRKGRVKTARVLLNGRAIPVTRGKRTSVLIDLRGRRAGTYTVRTSVVTRKGKLVTGTHRYRVCG